MRIKPKTTYRKGKKIINGYMISLTKKKIEEFGFDNDCEVDIEYTNKHIIISKVDKN